MFVLIILFMITLAFGLFAGLVYLLYLPFKIILIKKGILTKHKSRQINTIYIICTLLIAAYFEYNAFFPDDDFYKQEFNTVTLRDMPRSAEILEKAASYPDFHGDYASSAQIKLSKTDYNELLRGLSKDARFSREVQSGGFDEFTKTLGDKKIKDISCGFTRPITGKEDHYLYIGFYKDGQTIFVNVCLT